jgi:protein arginine phosphatase
MQRILFVCTGNTCRSPMAEAILKNKKMNDVQVKSAGIYAVNGCDATGHSKVVLDENKIPNDHKSSTLTEAHLDWATTILTMTTSHKMSIIQNFPKSVDKIYTLKEFVGEKGNLDVMDPFGGDLDTYRTTYEELERLINLITEK